MPHAVLDLFYRITDIAVGPYQLCHAHLLYRYLYFDTCRSRFCTRPQLPPTAALDAPHTLPDTIALSAVPAAVRWDSYTYHHPTTLLDGVTVRTGLPLTLTLLLDGATDAYSHPYNGSLLRLGPLRRAGLPVVKTDASPPGRCGNTRLLTLYPVTSLTPYLLHHTSLRDYYHHNLAYHVKTVGSCLPLVG